MLKRILKMGIIIILCNALAYAPLLRAEQLSLPGGDLIAPEITQAKYEESVPPGSDHEISVKVTDNAGVKQVILYYRVIGKSDYKRRNMQQVGNTDNYLATINADEIKSPGIEYYIQAMDHAGNSLLHGYSFSPLSVKLASTPAEADLAGVSEPAPTESAAKEKKGISKWVWIGLGALAVGALAAGGSSGGDSAPPPPGTATLSVNATEPTN